MVLGEMKHSDRVEFLSSMSSCVKFYLKTNLLAGRNLEIINMLRIAPEIFNNEKKCIRLVLLSNPILPCGIEN